MVDNVAKWIKEKYEWSMGCDGHKNQGQCPICDGVSLAWMQSGGWGDRYGHARHCKLAKALAADGCEVVWDRKYKGDKKRLLTSKAEAELENHLNMDGLTLHTDGG